MTIPTPRPALRRAADADVHPALSVVPARQPPLRGISRQGALDVVVPAVSPGKPSKSGKGKKAAKDKPFQGAGRSTSDHLRPPQTKLVSLNVKVPKNIRKDLRAVAKQSGGTTDQLVLEILNAWLGDQRRW